MNNKEINIMEKKKRTQIAFDVNPELHKQVKILAAMRNISMNLWIHRALVREINRQKRNKELEE
jgi:predicted HicB family RNase H-like nuclease